MSKLHFPTLHMNGTSADGLCEPITETKNKLECIYHDIQTAYDKMRGTAPNARDYYVQNPNGFEEARQEYYARQKMLDVAMAQIEKVVEELVKIKENVEDQVKARYTR